MSGEFLALLASRPAAACVLRIEAPSDRRMVMTTILATLGAVLVVPG